MSIYTAKWIWEKDGCDSPFFRKHINLSDTVSATLDICGLGWFEAYINGKKISDAVLCPGQSTYAQPDGSKISRGFYVWNDKITDTRCYYCSFDVSDMLKNGDNLLSVHLGNGYFNQKRRLGEGDYTQGAPRLCFSLSVKYADGSKAVFESDESVLCGKSGILENNLYYGEVHDLSLDNIHSVDFCEKNMTNATPAVAPEGKLCLWTATFDKVIRSVTPVCIGENDGVKTYDVGENIAGWIAFDTDTDGEIYLEFAENICGDKTLNITSTEHFWDAHERNQLQSCRYIGDGKPHRDVHPHFSWQGFRYFTVKGDAVNIRCDVVHTALPETGNFECDNKIINTVLSMYKRSQLANIHGCIPSDCPHRERLGYTGDGQITCETVMHMFDAREMYKKWMRDIVDGQCIDTGRVQNTAPFSGGGGGPAGWGGAIFVVPYTYYKMYGDPCLIKEYADKMNFYFEYLENRCDDDLLSRSEPGCWCLGDWCWPGCSAYSKDLSPRYVNTAYLVKFYDMMLELDEKLSLGFDRALYTERRQKHIDAIMANFFDSETGDFEGDRFGANAFAVNIGLGDERTFDNMVKKYDEFGGLDTGIFATELLIKTLGERGRADIVYKLLTSSKFNSSFYSMFKQGATTLWEDWDGHSSHNHPMFGGCFKAMWTVFLGINPLSEGYTKVKITPCDIEQLGNMSGYMQTKYGRISVTLKRDGERVKLVILVPEKCEAQLEFRGISTSLTSGVSIYEF
ncbi:MAG: family 78 glycoside hydrolase catalytic domain [Clostridia bacterium]|nr:family 78 glycoside hydrolase catalytic domain [Clostridia bacterium]